MCGIVYVNRKDGKPANRSVRKRYYAQKGRGSNGFGYVAIKDNEIVSYKRAPTEHEIMQELQKETAPEILFHHRFPTSTPNMEEQAHPLFVQGGNLKRQYLIAHNGVIRNASTRKIAHEALGFKYTTELKSFLQTSYTKKLYAYGDAKFNDSEALAVDVALALEGSAPDISAEGPAAVVGLMLEGSHVVERFFYRNRANPLKHHTDKVMTTLTSMGHGKEVDSIYLMLLNPDGTTRPHPAKIWSSYVYRDPPAGSAWGTRTHEAPSNLPTIITRAPHEHPTLPMTIDLGDDLRLDFSEGTGTFLSTMPLDAIWQEWERTHMAKLDLTKALEGFESRTTDMGVIGLEVIDAHRKLQGRLDRVNAYEVRITSELLRREAINEDVPILRGSKEDRILAEINRDIEGYD